MGISKLDENKDDFNELSKISKKLTILFILFWSLSIITPNTKEFATIYILPKITNNKEIQKIFKDSDEITQLLLKYTKIELKNKLLKLENKEGKGFHFNEK